MKGSSLVHQALMRRDGANYPFRLIQAEYAECYDLPL